MENLPLDRAKWPLLALLASAATLGAAYFFEYVLYLAPCQMCWWQRYVYFAAAPIALIAIVLNWRGAGPRTMTAFSMLLGVTFLVGTFLGSWHALFEWGLAPGPSGCEASRGSLEVTGNLSDILSRPIAVPSCKDPMWRDPVLRLSMAGWNAIVSTILAIGSFYSATQPPMPADTANEPVQA